MVAKVLEQYWEDVTFGEGGGDYTERMRVESGWIYCRYMDPWLRDGNVLSDEARRRTAAIAMVFVPDR